MKTTKVLAIESSCDETAIALLSVDEQGKNVELVHNLVSSQIPIHQKYGGVVPEVAARSHVPETVSLLTQALGEKGMDSFDIIAVTQGPGLATALRVGIEAGRVLAMLSGKPIIGVNHLEGHLASAWLDEKAREHWEYPMLALIVSGGHTELVLMKSPGKYKIVGQTRDDAAGEAFDKSAKLMGLPYPGGPQISKLALEGDDKSFTLPRPMLKDKTLDMSFSGLKTAVRLAWLSVADEEGAARETAKKNLSASVQRAIVDVLIYKSIKAAKKYKAKAVLLVGGVSANALLREELGAAIEKQLPGVRYFPSDKRYITDNAAMIAAAGYWRHQLGESHNWKTMDAKPEWNV